VTSADEPYLDAVYKLQEYGGRARRKRSTGKETWPGRKQVFRHYRPDGSFDGDVLAPEDDPQSGEPLLKPVMRAGRRVTPRPTLADARALAANQLARLPEPLRALEEAAVPYPVAIAPSLAALAKAVDRANERAGVMV
jgi:nicotinate phosphoribosyltransferase